MFPNLLEATKDYWRKLDELENTYKQDKISIDEVDATVAKLVAELAEERQIAFNYFWQNWQYLLTTQREIILGLAILVFVTYAWVLI